LPNFEDPVSQMNVNMLPAAKRIAVVAPKYGLVGGAERFSAEITERVAKTSEFEFHVFAQKWSSTSKSSIVFHRIPRLPVPRSLRPRFFAWLVASRLKSEHFDLVHSHARVFRADVATLHGIPHCAWVRDIRRKRTSFFDRETISVEHRMISSGADVTFLPVSSIARDIFMETFPNPPGHWQVMAPGVDFERFASPDRELCREEIRRVTGFGSRAFLVLFAGMNFELKGLDTVLQAVAETRSRIPTANVCLLVVGKGSESKYRAKAEALGIRNSVAFAGTVEVGLERYYRASDAFMMLSDFDSFGMVVLEAMAAGLPVVIGPRVGARDIVEDGTNGFILQNNRDPGEAADHLVLLCKPETSAAFSDSARKHASTRSWRTVGEEMCSVYRDFFARTQNEKRLLPLGSV